MIMQLLLYGEQGHLYESFYLSMIMAEAVSFCIKNKLPEHLYNVGVGNDLSINELALLIQSIVGHEGKR